MKKLHELDIDKDKLSNGLEEDPKIILVAPGFKDELLDTTDFIKFDIEPIKISRYETRDGGFLVSIDKPQIPLSVPKTVRVMEEWNWEKYEKEGISKRKNEIGKSLKENLDTILRSEEIDVEPIFRKFYIPYQSGRYNVFWISVEYTSWETGDVLIVFKLDSKPNLEKENIQIEHTKTKWNEDYGEWLIFFNKAVDLSPLLPIIKKSYEYITGAKTSD